jgi:hypothetical protein
VQKTPEFKELADEYREQIAQYLKKVPRIKCESPAFFPKDRDSIFSHSSQNQDAPPNMTIYQDCYLKIPLAPEGFTGNVEPETVNDMMKKVAMVIDILYTNEFYPHGIANSSSYSFGSSGIALVTFERSTNPDTLLSTAPLHSLTKQARTMADRQAASHGLEICRLVSSTVVCSPRSSGYFHSYSQEKKRLNSNTYSPIVCQLLLTATYEAKTPNSQPK